MTWIFFPWWQKLLSLLFSPKNTVDTTHMWIQFLNWLYIWASFAQLLHQYLYLCVEVNRECVRQSLNRGTAKNVSCLLTWLGLLVNIKQLQFRAVTRSVRSDSQSWLKDTDWSSCVYSALFYKKLVYLGFFGNIDGSTITITTDRFKRTETELWVEFAL